LPQLLGAITPAPWHADDEVDLLPVADVLSVVLLLELLWLGGDAPAVVELL